MESNREKCNIVIATGIKTLNPDGSIIPPLSAFDIWVREKHGGKDKAAMSTQLKHYFIKAKLFNKKQGQKVVHKNVS